VSEALAEAAAQTLEDPQLKKAEPCVIVIFGASGDLTRRKLMPALFNLMCRGSMTSFHIVGIGRDSLSEEEFRRRMREGASASDEMGEFTDEEWNCFGERIHYNQGDLKTPELYASLAQHLERIATENSGSRNHLFYCATPPSLAPAIVNGLGNAGLAKQEQGWSRIVVEKPFGSDLKSAQALNAEIAKVFSEDQVYRIDHYLGKDTVQNILVFRFGNTMFEPIWNRNYVDYVEITAAESIGIGSRAGYYEQAGALRDMVANHMLQLLSLTAMEPPVAFEADAVREQKVQVLRSIHRLTPDEVRVRTVRGQYGPGNVNREPVGGYRQEKGVRGDSTTETYAAVQFFVSNWRWADVPFYLRAGKRLARPLTEIAVHLKRTPQALFARTPSDQIEPNVIILRIQPNEAISVTFGAKRPGVDMRTGTVHLDFCYEVGFGARSPAAYQTLLLDVMEGDATLFTRRDEVEAQWRLITPILETWSKGTPELAFYAAGSEGPAAADELVAGNGDRWRRMTDVWDSCVEPAARKQAG